MLTHLRNGLVATTVLWVGCEILERAPIYILAVLGFSLLSWTRTKPDRELEGLSNGPAA